MITVISGTNRADNRTIVFARHFAALIDELGVASQLLDLTQLHNDILHAEVYAGPAVGSQLISWQRDFIAGASKFAIFVPEYNGSYPWVLKVFLDGISVVDYAGSFAGKHVALVGVASGRAGNLRGMDHLADVFAHLGAWVLPNRLPLSQIEGLLTEDQLTDEGTRQQLREHAEQLIAT
jgi:NAD(P)H-dependent FMN reductase